MPEALPPLSGLPVRVRFQPQLTAARGRLTSGAPRGTPVHAGAFLRQREIVLDEALLRTRGVLARILTHELFHFVWLRAGNRTRHAYEELLASELARGVRGELGWSAEWRKQALSQADLHCRTRRWREYACESFCDTAAWLFAGARSAECTLPRLSRERRREWMRAELRSPLPI